MTEYLKTAKSITGLLAWSSMYFAILASVLYIVSNDNSQYITALIMLLPFAGTIFFCMRAKNIIIYVAYHIGLIVLVWVLEGTPAAQGLKNTWVLTAAVLLQMILFLSKRIRAGSRKYFLSLPPILAVVFFILWIIANGMKLPSLAFVLVITACIYMLSCVLGIYLANMADYIDSNNQMANMPVSALIRSGNNQITVFMLLGITAVMLFTNMGLDRLLEQLKNLLLSGIRFLFSFAPNNTENIAPAPETATPSAPIEPPITADDSVPSPIAEAVSNIFITIVQIALIIGAVVLVFYILYQIWQRFNVFSFHRKKSKTAPDTEDVIEKLDTVKTRRYKFSFSPALPEDKIRRIYYKKIQSRHKKEPLDPAMTPKDLTESIHPADNEAAREFTRIYEQARYSGQPSPQDTAAYKNLSKKL